MEPMSRKSRISPLIVPFLIIILQLVDDSEAGCCCGNVCCPACCCCCPCQCVNPPLCIKLPRTLPCCCCCKPCCCCCCKPCCCCCGGGGGRRRKRRQAIASFQRQWEFQHPIHSALPLASSSSPAHIQLPILNRNLVDSNPTGSPCTTTPAINTAPLPPWITGNRKDEVEKKSPLLNTLIPVLKSLMRWPKRIVDELAESVVPPALRKNELEQSRLLSEKKF